MGEPGEDLVALRFERAVVEVRIGLRAGGGPYASSAAFWSSSLMSRRLMPDLPALLATSATP